MMPKITWFVFLELMAGFYLLFWLLQGASKLMTVLMKRNRYKKQFKKGFEILLEIYKPLAILFAALAFLLINFQVHGILLAVAALILFKQIRNYCNGIFFKINPLVDVGANLITGTVQGDIEKLTPLGLILKEEHGERFINYTTIEAQGFFINQKVDGSMRKTLYLLEDALSQDVMDVLFENPLIDFSQKPSITNVDAQTRQLQLTLEKGVKIKTIIDYLHQYNMLTSQTKP